MHSERKKIVTPGLSIVTGVPASGGVVSGPVRLVRGVDDFDTVEPGDVIVCRTTDPSWTVLLGLAAAVVTETGGILSHAAIVAREYGIPAVVAVEGAMAALADHRLVSVDGTGGHIRALARSEVDAAPSDVATRHERQVPDDSRLM
ncbi:PEP-utilizing enzyme [Nocardia terrae]|uniref:PEP-utilizing enzyme n=1 Tax=Nocardia terrae TaxID=2675851 RepID=UPI002E268614